MSEKKLKVRNVEVNKKEFHVSTKPITLGLRDIHKIVIFDKLEHSHNGSKYFIGYKEGIVKPLCIVFQMSGYIKYFDNYGKVCPLKLKMIVYW